MQGIIYKYTSPSNKSYIGQTIQGNLRKSQHKSNAYSEIFTGRFLPFYCAIRKYGFDSFIYEILITIDEEDENLTTRLNELEIYYIGKYDTFNNGYNASIGGGGLSGNTHPSCKRIAQYSLNGEFINSYLSASEITKILNYDSSAIIKCCKLKERHCNKFQWRYIIDGIDETLNIGEVPKKKSPNTVKLGKDNHRSKTVYQYDLDMIFIKKWDCVADITRELGIDSGSISKVCNGKQSYCGKVGTPKYIFKYEQVDSPKKEE